MLTKPEIQIIRFELDAYGESLAALTQRILAGNHGSTQAAIHLQEAHRELMRTIRWLKALEYAGSQNRRAPRSKSAEPVVIVTRSNGTEPTIERQGTFTFQNS